MPSDPITISRPWLAAYPAEIAWNRLDAAPSLDALFRGAVARFGARPALDFMGRRWTYAELEGEIAGLSGALARRGIGSGTRVGLCLPNSPASVVAFFAILRTGAAVVNFNPLYTETELAKQAADSAITAMVTLDLAPMLPRVLALKGLSLIVVGSFDAMLPPMKRLGFLWAGRRLRASVPEDPRVLRFEALIREPPAPAAAIAPGDLAVIQYTGGTTGVPKGAMLTHANLAANAAQVQAWFHRARPGEERLLAVLPLFHVFALTCALTAGVGWGAELILLPRFDVRTTIRTLRRTQPTIFPGVPTLFKALLDAGAGRQELGGVRACISGGAPLPEQVRIDFETASGTTLVEGYGLTEASPVCLCNPVTAPRGGTIGLPLPLVEVAIRALDAPESDVPLGERGEVVVRGPNIMAGYWNRAAETRATMTADGWLRTGDVGVMDGDGFVTLVDRIKDLIICSGYNVYPRVVEEALYQHADVVAATVVGMQDAYRGETPVAFVEMRPGAARDEKELREFLRTRLSPIEMPARIIFRDKLPRTIIGKLSKKELRAELLGERQP